MRFDDRLHTRLASLLGLSLALAACSPTPAPSTNEKVGQVRSDTFINGDFEGGTANVAPTGWTVTSYLDPGVTITTPQTRAGLNLTSGGNPLTYTLNAPGGPESEIDTALGAGASLRWPRYGNNVAIVNQRGLNRNANSLSQTMTVAAADIDSVDGLVHVRFVVAPVLENPNHAPNQQPYYFVQLTNLSRSLILYNDYNASAQPGVPWKISNGYYYTDWQLVDIAPGSATLAVGDQIQLEVIGSGCAAGGHFGQVYVDGVGSSIPGAFVSATGPASANDGTNITYTLNYKNGGTGGVGGATVEFNVPANTNYQSINAPGLTCTTPAVGAGGLVSCALGTLVPGATGSFEVTVQIDVGATGTITNGDYDIYGLTVSPLIGSKVYTAVTSGVTYADLGVTITNGVSSLVWGQPVTYTVQATNQGPNAVTGATVTNAVPTNITNVTWTCAGSSGGTCASAGSGGIADATVGLPVGGKVTYTVSGTVAAGSGSSTVHDIASIAIASGGSDSNPANNSAGDNDPILSVNGGGCTLNSDCVNGACDSIAHTCGYAVGDGPCTTANAAAVCLSGFCSVVGTCEPASGCNVDGDCAAGLWCNEASHACSSTLANGAPIPSDPSHANPALNGTCTPDAATLVCASGVCDPVDNACGYGNGDGSCTPGDASGCRGGSCSVTTNTCIPSGGCAADADCASGNWCNTSSFTCVPQIANGQGLPTAGGHTPPLTGVCTPAAASAVCVSGVCDPTANTCGFADGEGPCTPANGAVVCGSGACSVSGNCRPSGGCNVDGDCHSGDWCEISTHACTPQVANGGVMPTDTSHESPTLDGHCSAAAATLVCVSGVCDAADDRCGQANGDGPCDAGSAAKVCRSGACDPDLKCGLVNGDGPCTQGNAGVVCRAGGCSVNGSVCEPEGGCAVDADCGASQWCNTQSFSCTSKLSAGASIPTVSGHTPALSGTCTVATGTSVCAEGVCDTTDDSCGYQNGDGPCTVTTGIVVCRSGVCSVTGVCQEPATCDADGDCDVTLYCDTGAHLCAPKLPNGTALPTVAGHTPVLDGICSNAEAAVLCQSNKCDPTDNACGYANGDGACTAQNAGTVCRSSACSPNANVCIPSGGCAIDADCTAASWCNTQTLSCTAKLTNGTAIPTVTGHLPALTGVCSDAASTAVCASGVCDANDNSCGYAKDDGPCTAADATTVCRTGICSVSHICIEPASCAVDDDCDDTQYCDTAARHCAAKVLNGVALPVVAGHQPTLDGACSNSAAEIVCASGVCDAIDNKCGHAIGNGPCDTEDGAATCRSSVCATSGQHQGTCVECVADLTCSGAQSVCDTTANACVQCTPADNDACTGATPVCAKTSKTCVPCGADFGEAASNACISADAPYCFLSGATKGQCGKCGSDAECKEHGANSICDVMSGACGTACTSDEECDKSSYCNAKADGSGICAPKLANGSALPNKPADLATCTKAVGKLVCISGVCDAADDTCGYKNGDGPCTDASVCRSGACDSKDKTCGLNAGDGPCKSDAACRNGKCDEAKAVCSEDSPPPANLCKVDNDCSIGQFCNASSGCVEQLDKGETCASANQCSSNLCISSKCDTFGSSGDGLTCTASVPTGSHGGWGALTVGLALALSSVLRRRRR